MYVRTHRLYVCANVMVRSCVLVFMDVFVNVFSCERVCVCAMCVCVYVCMSAVSMCVYRKDLTYVSVYARMCLCVYRCLIEFVCACVFACV